MADYVACVIDGIRFNQTPDLLRVRTAKECEMVLDVRRVGLHAVTWVGGGFETVVAEDTAAFARWALRLEVEFRKSVELRITPSK